VLFLIGLHIETDLVRPATSSGPSRCRLVLRKGGRRENHKENRCKNGFHDDNSTYFGTDWFPAARLGISI